ncbi:MAG: Nif3-like dinuclear metal center hexameric protein [Candidatus Kapabacteria bacterium]|nr:Nif3-like dinuclear metal center hexameric protein [Candidatus Kapabacteria bacterium]
MQLNNLLDEINVILPWDSALENDKVGLQIKVNDGEVRKILVTIEVNDEVVDEAVINKCDTIITFHPLIYYPLATITESERASRICIKLIQNNINLISIHTAYDVYSKGTSRLISDRLDLVFIDYLDKNTKYNDCGLGVISRFKKPVSSDFLIEKLSDLFSSPVRFCYGKKNLIETVGIIGGSGSSYLDKAISKDLDAFITADVSYHKFHQAKDKILLADIGHYEMEVFVVEGLTNLMTDILKSYEDISVLPSMVHTNPVNYYPKGNFIENQKKLLVKY